VKLLYKLLIAFSISIPVLAADLLSSKPIDWQPVVGYTSPGSRGYYDRNSIHEIKDADSRTVFANILVVSDNIVEGRAGPKIYKAKSLVRIIMISCTNEYIIPVFDLYYSVDFPLNTDTPVHAIDYGSSLIPVLVNKKSPLYYTLCPNYI
jgi:hypothetical protein